MNTFRINMLDRGSRAKFMGYYDITSRACFSMIPDHVGWTGWRDRYDSPMDRIAHIVGFDVSGVAIPVLGHYQDTKARIKETILSHNFRCKRHWTSALAHIDDNPDYTAICCFFGSLEDAALFRMLI